MGLPGVNGTPGANVSYVLISHNNYTCCSCPVTVLNIHRFLSWIYMYIDLSVQAYMYTINEHCCHMSTHLTNNAGSARSARTSWP